MTTEFLSAPDSGSCLRLVAERNDGSRTEIELEPGKSLMVGRGKHCGLQLESEAVGPIQCVFRSVDGTLWLQDWYSSSGTTIDGQAVHGETKVNDRSDIRCGEYRIRVVLQDTDSSEPKGATAPTPMPEVEPIPNPPPVLENHSRSPQPFSLGKSPLTSSDPFAQETIDLLRAELEQLQHELHDRDSRISELEELAHQSGVSAEATEASFDPHLERLDELLLELQQSDDRLMALEDLLRLSEEATAAEREERRQLEAWLGDIEHRVSQRDSEWQAEMDALQRRLADTESERERLWQQATSGDSHASGNGQWQSTELMRWREKQADTERRLLEMEKDRDRLRTQVETLEARSTAEGRRAQLDDAFREERAQIAQERAELSRQRAEMAAIRAEVPQLAATGPGNIREIDSRLRAFREHLREIHEHEQSENSQRTLTARIGKLWRKLEGKAD